MFQLVGMIRLKLLDDLDVPCATSPDALTAAAADPSATAKAVAAAGHGGNCTARYPWWLLPDLANSTSVAGEPTQIVAGDGLMEAPSLTMLMDRRRVPNTRGANA